MKRATRRAPEFDLRTPCTACGYAIAPAEIVRIGGLLIRCPRCGAEFEPDMKKPDPHANAR